MLEKLRAIHERANKLRGWWSVGGKIYDGSVMNMRKREPHEYPENQLDYWAGTCCELQALFEEISAAHRFAIEQYRKIRNSA